MPDLADSELIRVERVGAVAVIRLDRPPVNALNAEMLQAIGTAAAALSADPSVRAVVLYGGERAFAAGGDIKEMAELSAVEMETYSRTVFSAMDVVAAVRQPVTAAITGYALGGGCELALAADFRVIAENAKIGLPEILLGVIPGAGGTQRLPRLVGVTKAKEMIFGGRPVDGVEAVRIGLASRAVPAGEVYETALEWATQLAAGPTMALAAAKEAIDQSTDVDLVTGLALEGRVFSALFDTDDQRIGMTSFLENGPGKASFTGR